MLAIVSIACEADLCPWSNKNSAIFPKPFLSIYPEKPAATISPFFPIMVLLGSNFMELLSLKMSLVSPNTSSATFVLLLRDVSPSSTFLTEPISTPAPP